MNDLISRQAAIMHFVKAEKKYECWMFDLKEATHELWEVPSAEPEIIRCKDCKYFEIVQLTKSGEDDKRYKPSVCVNGKYAVRRNENWFCADAERRTDE